MAGKGRKPTKIRPPGKAKPGRPAKSDKPISELGEQPFLTVAEAAKLLRVSSWTIYKAIEGKRYRVPLRAMRLDRSYRIRRQDLDAWVEALLPPESDKDDAEK